LTPGLNATLLTHSPVLSAQTSRKAKNIEKSGFHSGWDEDRVKRVLSRYESQSEKEAVAEDEAAWED